MLDRTTQGKSYEPMLKTHTHATEKYSPFNVLILPFFTNGSKERIYDIQSTVFTVFTAASEI